MDQIIGDKGVKTLLEKALDNKEKVLRSALSNKPLVYFVDNEFAESYMKKRKETGIHLKSLRFTSEDVDLDQHKDYDKYGKEVRVAPKEIQIGDSVLIWDDNVAIVDTNQLKCIIIENKEHADLMKKWFDYIWNQSA